MYSVLATPRRSPDGSDRSAVVATSGVGEKEPYYSPNGVSVFYTRDNSGQDEIYKKAVSGGAETNVSGNAANDSHAEIRPINETRTIDTELETAIEDSENPTYHDATITFAERESYVPAASYECRMDGGSWSTCTSPVTYNNLSLGVEHTFDVRGTSGGVTEAPVSTTWTTTDEVAEDPTMGLVVASWFYSLHLDSLFGDALGPRYAGLSGHDHLGSVAYASGVYPAGPAMARSFSQLYSGIENGNTITDATIRTCKRTTDHRIAWGYAYNRQSDTYHIAVAKRDNHCNATYKNANHELHYTKDWRDAFAGAISRHPQ